MNALIFWLREAMTELTELSNFRELDQGRTLRLLPACPSSVNLEIPLIPSILPVSCEVFA